MPLLYFILTYSHILSLSFLQYCLLLEDSHFSYLPFLTALVFTLLATLTLQHLMHQLSLVYVSLYDPYLKTLIPSPQFSPSYRLLESSNFTVALTVIIIFSRPTPFTPTFLHSHPTPSSSSHIFSLQYFHPLPPHSSSSCSTLFLSSHPAPSSLSIPTPPSPIPVSEAGRESPKMKSVYLGEGGDRWPNSERGEGGWGGQEGGG